jgi:hypothetical protein
MFFEGDVALQLDSGWFMAMMLYKRSQMSVVQSAEAAQTQ